MNMADFDFINYEEYENWLAVVVGLAVTVEGLQDYCQSKLDVIQRTIQKIVGKRNFTACVNNCSKTKCPNGKDWCNMCFAWRKQLETFNRDRRQWNGIIWSKINSKDWTTKHQEIAKVFMKQIPDSQNPIEDLSSILSLFRNCVEFQVAEQLIVNVSIVRNRYYAHYSKLKLTWFEKQKCLDILNTLLSIEQIKSTKSARRAIHTIEHLKLVHHISKDIINQKTREKLVVLVNSKLKSLCTQNHSGQIDTRSATQANENYIHYLRERIEDFVSTKKKRNILTTLCFRLLSSRVFLLVLILFTTHISLLHKKYNQQKVEGKKTDQITIFADGPLAFIASSDGNMETLKWLLDNGVDINFEKETSNYRHIPKYDLVEECKYVYFCGYNFLEIASQNGHSDTVNFLLKRSINLQHKTLFGLTALDLAIENGHNQVIEILLRSNQTFSSHHSIFKASEKGHFNTVYLLIKLGFNDMCIPCGTSLYWLKANEHRAQQIYYTVNNIFEPHNFSFIDDWQLITCESALHAAVRNCHLGVIDVLIRQQINTIECVDRSGMTPVLSSIKYNCSQGFKMLFERGANKTFGCKNMPNISQLEALNEVEKQKYDNYSCPNGAKIAHVLAMFFNLDIMEIIVQNSSFLLNVRDSEGRTPLHYSNCFSGVGLWSIVHRPKLRTFFDFYERSKNGSTPYHSAAYCKSFIGHVVSYCPDWISQEFKKISLNHGISDVLDNDGRSIIHYYFLGIPDWSFDSIFLRMYFENNLDFSRVDKYGKNFLHYAVKSGNIHQIQYIFNLIPATVRKNILMQKDIKNVTPLAEAFNRVPHKPYYHYNVQNPILKLPNCSLLEVFTVNCKANLSFLLQPTEQFAIDIISLYLNNNIPVSSINLTDLMYIAANKSSLYSILMLYTYYHLDFMDLILDSKLVFNLLHLFNGPFLADIIIARKSVLRCSEHFDTHPFAAIVMNYEDYFWTYSNNDSYSNFLGNVTSDELDECFDNDGYNLLHRAAIGGNSFALQYLITKGMNISILTKENDTLLDLIIKHAFYSKNGNPIINTNVERLFIIKYHNFNNSVVSQNILISVPLSISNYDAPATFILLKISEEIHGNRKFWKEKFCQHKIQNLGFVHLAAAKGLYSFIKATYDIFGRRVINCLNKHNISPYYLAKVNDQTNLIAWFREKKFDLELPQKWLIPIIAYLYSVNFKPDVDRARNCRWSVLKPSNFITKQPFHICFKVNITLKGTHLSQTNRGQFIPNYFGLWINWIWYFRYRAKALKRILYETCLFKQYSQCLQIVKEVGLHFQGANLASRLLYQNLRLFKGNHMTYWASYIMMFKSKNLSRVPVQTLYKTVFSGKVNYLNTLQMADKRHNTWLSAKLSDITIRDPMVNYNVANEMDNEDSRFLQYLFRYFQMFHFQVLEYPYHIAYQDD